MPKRLVICADGTWNKPERESGGKPCPTNVVKFASAILPEDSKGIAQVVCYHEGVGCEGSAWDHLSGGAFGIGISRNIQDFYLFLSFNYSPDDELWLFGFSRGAYTVRSLAGLIRNCGILKRENTTRYKDAYDLYRDRTPGTHPTSEKAKEFRKTYSWPDFNIHFVGVWDTVGALGIPVRPLRYWTKKNFEFHDVDLSSHVNYAYQALAIDEQRKSFTPSVWKKQATSPLTQQLEQAWFPGVHSDVGGGYSDCGLSNGALLWVWKRAERAGLALNSALMPIPDSGGPLHDSMTLFYKILGDGTRQMGKKNPPGKEGIAQSTLDRMSKRSEYKPANLVAFLESKPPVSQV